jgi:hypothetical protein
MRTAQRVRGFGTARGQAETRGLYEELLGDPRCAAFGYDDDGLVGYAEALGHRGAPCPQPDYPTFDIEFPT